MFKRTTVIRAALTISFPWTFFVGTLAAADEPVAPAQKIRPLDWSMLGGGSGNDELAAVCTSVMAHSQEGMGKSWLDRIAKTKRVDGLLDFGHREPHIRPTAASSRTLALALRLGQYRADKAGAKTSEIETLLPLVVRSLAKDHKVNGGLGDRAWGDQWQSAMWAAQTAQLAWIIWDRLTIDDHKLVVAMLAHEADRFLEKAPPISNAASVNDTKGEENAWNAGCMMTASIMLIKHPHEKSWRERAIVYYLNAVATPQDVDSRLVVDGKPLSERLVGYCITADYAVGNHGAYPHPGYTASSYLDARMLFLSALAGVQPPEAILYNAAPIYRMFVDHQWTAPPCMKPGGSIYKDDGGIYWPTKKEKQRAGRYYKWFSQDVLAATYGFDASCSTKATHWAKLHGQVMIDAFNGKPTPIKLEAYSKDAFFKNALSCYLIRTLHVNKHLAPVRALATQKPVAPATTKSKGKRVFFTGHSFFIAGGYMAKKLDLIAKAAGKEKHELVGWRYSGGRSGAVDKWWEKGADQEPRKSVAAGKVDVLTVCTYWMKKGSEQERCVQNFVKLMQESNPDGLVYLITTKIPFDGQYQDKGGWNARTKAELAKLSGWVDETHRYANHHGALVDEINKAYGKTVIKAVPLYYGQALLRMQIIDGQVPGVKKQSELYRDAMGHVSELGQRLNAFTVFAAIYGGTPVGLQVPEWEKSGDAVRRAQNMSLQNAAWAAVQAAPVTREGRNRSIKE